MAKGTQYLLDDEISRIRILYTDAGFKVSEIVKITSYSKNQVHRAIFAPQGPRQRKGPFPALSLAEEAELVRFITGSKQNRQMPWSNISTLLFNGKYGNKAIRSAFRRLGYKRYLARPKPPLTAERMAQRKAFDNEHKDWTPQQ
jgi:transposase